MRALFRVMLIGAFVLGAIVLTLRSTVFGLSATKVDPRTYDGTRAMADRLHELSTRRRSQSHLQRAGADLCAHCCATSATSRSRLTTEAASSPRRATAETAAAEGRRASRRRRLPARARGGERPSRALRRRPRARAVASTGARLAAPRRAAELRRHAQHRLVPLPHHRRRRAHASGGRAATRIEEYRASARQFSRRSRRALAAQHRAHDPRASIPTGTSRRPISLERVRLRRNRCRAFEQIAARSGSISKASPAARSSTTSTATATSTSCVSRMSLSPNADALLPQRRRRPLHRAHARGGPRRHHRRAQHRADRLRQRRRARRPRAARRAGQARGQHPDVAAAQRRARPLRRRDRSRPASRVPSRRRRPPGPTSTTTASSICSSRARPSRSAGLWSYLKMRHRRAARPSARRAELQASPVRALPQQRRRHVHRRRRGGGHRPRRLRQGRRSPATTTTTARPDLYLSSRSQREPAACTTTAAPTGLALHRTSRARPASAAPIDQLSRPGSSTTTTTAGPISSSAIRRRTSASRVRGHDRGDVPRAAAADGASDVARCTTTTTTARSPT